MIYTNQANKSPYYVDLNAADLIYCWVIVYSNSTYDCSIRKRQMTKNALDLRKWILAKWLM